MNIGLERNTGFEVIKIIPWGAHIAQLFSTKTELFGLSVPFIKTGLQNNELCIWIYSGNTSVDEIKGYFLESGMDIDPYLEKGQLKLISYVQMYLGPTEKR